METIEILEQIFDQNYAVLEVELIKDKLYAKIKSLSVDDYFEIDTAMTGIRGTELKITQQFAVEKLSRGLIFYKDKDFLTPESAKEFLMTSKLSATVMDKLLKAQHEFEKDIKKAMGMDSIEEAFFAPVDSQEKQEPLPAVSTLENQEVLENQS